MAEALVVVDDEQRLCLANRAFCDLCGVAEGAACGQPLFGLLTISAADRLRSLLGEAARESRTLDRVPLEATLASGRRSFVLTARPLSGADGTPLCVLTLRDNVFAARAVEAVDATNKQLVEINHRVKNNLTAILAMLRLEGRNLADGAARDMLERIGLRVRAIASLYELLTVERRSGNVGLLNYFRTVARSIELVAGRDRGSWTIEVTGEDVDVSIDDAVKYGAIVNELVANAVKYAFGGVRAGGRVSIRCERVGPNLEVTVADNGSGIGGGQRLDETTSTGLGIRLVDLYLQALEGVMERSTAPGCGTTCVLRIPYRPPPPDPAMRPTPTPALYAPAEPSRRSVLKQRDASRAA